jgi:putative addiction module component (TIGR02574 family)
MTTEQIEQVLMQLPPGERARLAERLIASLDADAEVEAAWIAEARRRDEEMRSGTVEGIPLKDALDSVRSRFGW